MTSKRTLYAWRRDALIKEKELRGWDNLSENTMDLRLYSQRILVLTQELIDLQLLKKEDK